MKIKHCLIVGSSALLLLCNSCTNKDYDLSDIDKTVSFKAKELTVPINLEYLTLDQVMDLKENSEVKKMKDANGNDIYAVLKEGTFKSSKINVKQITATPQISHSSKDLSTTATPIAVPGGLKVEFDITGVPPTTFKANATGVDESIRGIDNIGISSRLITRISLQANGSSVNWSNVKIKGLKIEFPRGLKCSASKGTFIESSSSQPDYSLLDLSGEVLTVDASGKVEEILINAEMYDIKDNESIKFDSKAHTLDIVDQVNIQTGTIELITSGTIPSSIKITLAPAMDRMVVTTFTGLVEYKVQDLKIDPIDLSSLPDFLNQAGTKLGLENPQIYVGINNPLGNVKSSAAGGGIYMETDFKMTPERDGKVAKAHSLNNGAFQIVGGTTAEQTFVMSPSDPKTYYEGFTNPKFVQYTGLKEILKETDGVPTKITVEAVDPKLPEQNVYNFALGSDYGVVEGRYTFYAPLQLSNDTRILYTDTIDGWNDKDVDAITINNIRLNMSVSTDVPFPLNLEVVPITFNAKTIPGVTSSTVSIPAKAKDYATEFTINGTVTHLDGLLIKAKVQNPDDQTVLGPQMKLYIKNSKVTLTGNYTKEL